jgi:hypothetical protein
LQCSAVSGTPSTVTIVNGLNNAVADDAVVTMYTEQPLVNKIGDYAAGYHGPIVYDGTGAPTVGQIVSFGSDAGVLQTGNPQYMVTQLLPKGTANSFYVDRPLDQPTVNNGIINLGPNGDLNFAFHRNALALVNRPLLPPMSGTGARSATAEHNGLSMRVTITYDGSAQGHRVTLDSLFGTAVLDTNLGCVVCG